MQYGIQTKTHTHILTQTNIINYIKIKFEKNIYDF